jgi:hypothetical protein
MHLLQELFIVAGAEGNECRNGLNKLFILLFLMDDILAYCS